MSTTKHGPKEPLLSRGQLFQIRAKTTFDLLRRINEALQNATQRLDAAVLTFYTLLPAGYFLVPYGECLGEKTYALQFDGNDVGWPLTQQEAFYRAYSDLGCPAPEISKDPAIAKAQAERIALEAQQKTVSAQLDEIERATPEPSYLWRDTANTIPS